MAVKKPSFFDALLSFKTKHENERAKEEVGGRKVAARSSSGLHYVKASCAYGSERISVTGTP